MGEGPSKPEDGGDNTVTVTASKPSHGGVPFLMRPWMCQPRDAKPSDTVIIFDWDDTLLCSSAINLQQWSVGQLQQLELTAETILCASMDLGETLIVTNGNKSWVQDSARRFMPKLIPLLSKLRVMSARFAYEQSWPGEPFAWKKAAFSEIFSEREASGVSGVNLVVIGDSFAEIEAAQTATSSLRGTSVVKTVKLKEMPSVNELLGELRVLTQQLPDIVNEDCSMSKVLVPRSLPPHLGYLTSWASGWVVSDQDIQRELFDTNSTPPLAPNPVLATSEVVGSSHIDSQSPVTLAGG